MQVKVELNILTILKTLCKGFKICILLSMFNLCLSKQGDASASSLQRVFMKDLQVTKVIKGTDIQVQHPQSISETKSDLANVIRY